MADEFDTTETIQVVDGRDDLPVFIHSELDDLGLSLQAFRVYAHLARRRNARTGTAWPSYATIGETCFRPNFPKASQTTLRRKAMAAVKELVGRGLVTVHQRKAEHGGFTSSEFRLTPRSAWQNTGVVSLTPGVVSMTPGGVIDTKKDIQLNTSLVLQKDHEGGAPSAVADDAGHAPAKSPIPQNQKPKGQPLPPTKNQAVAIVREVTGKAPNQTQAAAITQAIDDTERWRNVVQDWTLSGYKAGNVAGMIDVYCNGWRDDDRRRRNHRRHNPYGDTETTTPVQADAGTITQTTPTPAHTETTTPVQADAGTITETTPTPAHTETTTPVQADAGTITETTPTPAHTETTTPVQAVTMYQKFTGRTCTPDDVSAIVAANIAGERQLRAWVQCCKAGKDLPATIGKYQVATGKTA